MNICCIILRFPFVRRSLIAVALAALLVSLLRLVTPLQERARLQHRLSAVMAKGAEQAILSPLLAEMKNADKVDSFAALAPPAKHALRQEEVATVSTRFEQLAAAHGFEIGRVQLRMISDSPQRLLAAVLPLNGDYEQFGAVLKELLLLPSLESLDRVSVHFEYPVDRVSVELKLALE